MLRISIGLWAGAALLALTPTLATAADEPAAAEKYTLRYKFAPGETIRWEVVHRGRIRSTISGTTQAAETVSKSVKAWRITEVKEDGAATFEHSVESVDMWHKFTGQQEVRYNSRSDKKVPLGYENVAQSIGVPLSTVTVSPRGEIVSRVRLQKSPQQQNDGLMCIPLPEEPVAVGHTWSIAMPIEVPQPTGTVKKIDASQKFTLSEVKNGVATIQIATQILTPIHDPAIEAQLIQSQSSGFVRLDIDAGRVLSQQLDVDKGVVGFRGDASSMHCLSRFTEELLNGETETAARPDATREF
jgi:hypothetical protein